MNNSTNNSQSDHSNALPLPPGLGSLAYNNDLNNNGFSGESRLERYSDNRYERNNYFQGDISTLFFPFFFLAQNSIVSLDPAIENNQSNFGGGGYSASHTLKDAKNKDEDVGSLSTDYDLQRTPYSSYSIIPPTVSNTSAPGGRGRNFQSYNSKGSYPDGSSFGGSGGGGNPGPYYGGNSQASHVYRPEESSARPYSSTYNYGPSGYYSNNHSGYGDLQDSENVSQANQYSTRIPPQPSLYQQQQQQPQQQQQLKGRDKVSFVDGPHMLDDEAMHQMQITPTHLGGKSLPFLPQQQQLQQQQYKPQSQSQLPPQQHLQQQNYSAGNISNRSNPQYIYQNNREPINPVTGGPNVLPSPSARISYASQNVYTGGYQQSLVGMGGGGGGGVNPYSPKHSGGRTPPASGTGGSNAQGRAINKMLLDILRERVIDPQRLELAIETYTERMDCVNVATLLFHTGKKRLLLSPAYISRIANRLNNLKEELRAREASNALYGLKCMTSDVPEVKELVSALATKLSTSTSEFLAQAVGNALYGCQMMTSEHEEVRQLLQVLAVKVSQCSELLEAQNVGNALYGLRGMNSDHKEVRAVINALTPKIATAREDLNGQALGNSLYGLQSMSSKEPEGRIFRV